MAVIVLSCSKEAIEPENYTLHVQNRYFEAVTVSVGEHFSEKLSPNTVSKVFTLPKGTYKVVAHGFTPTIGKHSTNTRQ